MKGNIIMKNTKKITVIICLTISTLIVLNLALAALVIKEQKTINNIKIDIEEARSERKRKSENNELNEIKHIQTKEDFENAKKNREDISLGKGIPKEEHLKALEKSFGIYDEENSRVEYKEKYDIEKVKVENELIKDITVESRFTKGNVDALEYEDKKKEKDTENKKNEELVASTYDEETTILELRERIANFLDRIGAGSRI